MVTVSLTDLNQRPSHVARLAETEPVHIQKYGRSFLVLQRERDPIEEMRAAGLIRPPKSTLNGPLPTTDLEPEVGEALYEEFLASRTLS